MENYIQAQSIPGQSLTRAPGAAAWERPPQIADNDEALDFYIERFDDPEAREALFQLIELGVPIQAIVTLQTRLAVRKGIHSVHTAFIIRPALHQYYTMLADAAGVDFNETASDLAKTFSGETDNKDKIEQSLISAQILKKISTEGDKEAEEFIDDLSEANKEEPLEEEKPKMGIMSKRDK